MECLETKCCSRCKEIKPVSSFSRRSQGLAGYRAACKSCAVVATKARGDRDPERRLERGRIWRKNNQTHVKASMRAWYEANKETRQAYNRRYKQSHRDSINTRREQRKKSDMQYKLRCWISTTTCNAAKGSKTEGSLELLGCTPAEFRLYLEAQFLPGMSWDNHGEWHIDHVLPISEFDLTDPTQMREAFNYLNTQPMWAFDNISKGAKVPKGFHL